MTITTLYANPLSAGFDPWEQMIGEANISWYNLGNDVLFMLVDSKSNTSLYYHIQYENFLVMMVSLNNNIADKFSLSVASLAYFY